MTTVRVARQLIRLLSTTIVQGVGQSKKGQTVSILQADRFRIQEAAETLRLSLMSPGARRRYLHRLRTAGFPPKKKVA